MRAGRMLAVLLLSLGGCSAASMMTGIFPVDGTWAEVESVPGSSLMITLTSSGSSVTGSGTFMGEAGPQGTVNVTGTTNAGSVHLDLVMQQTAPVAGRTFQQQFDGTTTATELRGTMTYPSSTPPSSAPVVFRRQ